MSINIVRAIGSGTRNLNSRSLNQSVGYYDPYASDYYSEPEEWPELPYISETDEKIVLLVRVDPVLDDAANNISFKVAVNSGNVRIDWGDGNVDEGTYSVSQASHDYNLTSRNLTSVSDLKTGESASAGYGIALVTITPVNASSYFTSFTNQASTTTNHYGSVLSIKMAASSLSTLEVNDFRGLRRFEYVGKNSITSFTSLFSGCRQLEKVIIDVSSVTTGGYVAMFSSCYRLTDVTLNDTPRGSYSSRSADSMFRFCYSLRRAPDFITTGVTDMGTMFGECTSLEYVPFYDTSSVTDMSNMFQGCNCLENVPLFETSSVTTMASIFTGCSSLEVAPFFDTSQVTTMFQAFYQCYSLRYVPPYDFSSCTIFTNTFLDCISLTHIPSFTMNTTSISTLSSIFGNCPSLKTIGELDLSGVSSTQNFFSSIKALSLERIQITGMGENHDYLNCNLGPEALNEIYTNLPTVVGKTITVTGNWGTAYHDATIATSKGWTVTT